MQRIDGTDMSNLLLEKEFAGNGFVVLAALHGFPGFNDQRDSAVVKLVHHVDLLVCYILLIRS